MEIQVKYTFVEELDENMQSFEEKTDIVEVEDSTQLDVWLAEKYPPWVPGGDTEHQLTYGCRDPVVRDGNGRVILFRRDPQVKWRENQ